VNEAAGVGVNGSASCRRGGDRAGLRQRPARAHIAAIRAHKVALKGRSPRPSAKGFKSVNVQLRQKLNLYAAVRPCDRSRRQDALDGIDMVIVRREHGRPVQRIENEIVPAW